MFQLNDWLLIHRETILLLLFPSNEDPFQNNEVKFGNFIDVRITKEEYILYVPLVIYNIGIHSWGKLERNRLFFCKTINLVSQIASLVTRHFQWNASSKYWVEGMLHAEKTQLNCGFNLCMRKLTLTYMGAQFMRLDGNM